MSHYFSPISQMLPPKLSSWTDIKSSMPELALGIYTPSERRASQWREYRLLGKLRVNGQARAWLSGQDEITIFNSCAGSLCGDRTQWHQWVGCKILFGGQQ